MRPLGGQASGLHIRYGILLPVMDDNKVHFNLVAERRVVVVVVANKKAIVGFGNLFYLIKLVRGDKQANIRTKCRATGCDGKTR